MGNRGRTAEEKMKPSRVSVKKAEPSWEMIKKEKGQLINPKRQENETSS